MRDLLAVGDIERSPGPPVLFRLTRESGRSEPGAALGQISVAPNTQYLVTFGNVTLPAKVLRVFDDAALIRADSGKTFLVDKVQFLRKL